MIGLNALCVAFAAASLAGCGTTTVRHGPYIDMDAPAPFLSAMGNYPTQGQAQSAVGRAVKQLGTAAVYRKFGGGAPDRVPTHVALFACKPGFYRSSMKAIAPWPGFVYCSVDVMDQNYGLLGRASMSFFTDRQGRWSLASNREREENAR